MPEITYEQWQKEISKAIDEAEKSVGAGIGDFLQSQRQRKRGKWKNRIQGARGKRSRCNVSSKYKGVDKTKNRILARGRRQRYRARIQFGKKNIYLGDFVDEKEAALAYDRAAEQLFGKYAYTNQMAFPEDFAK